MSLLNPFEVRYDALDKISELNLKELSNHYQPDYWTEFISVYELHDTMISIISSHKSGSINAKEPVLSIIKSFVAFSLAKEGISPDEFREIVREDS